MEIGLETPKEMLNKKSPRKSKYELLQELKKAIEQKNIEQITDLIAQKVDLNAKFEDGQTPLFFAIRMELSSIVRILVDNGADVLQEDINGKNSLRVVGEIAGSYRSYQEITQILLNKARENQSSCVIL